MTLFAGLVLVLLAGILQGSFILPMTLTRHWKWEHNWAGIDKGLPSSRTSNLEYYEKIESEFPASQPVAHADWKLKPPVTPSMSSTSPAK